MNLIKRGFPLVELNRATEKLCSCRDAFCNYCRLVLIWQKVGAVLISNSKIFSL